MDISSHSIVVLFILNIESEKNRFFQYIPRILTYAEKIGNFSSFIELNWIELNFTNISQGFNFLGKGSKIGPILYNFS